MKYLLDNWFLVFSDSIFLCWHFCGKYVELDSFIWYLLVITHREFINKYRKITGIFRFPIRTRRIRRENASKLIVFNLDVCKLSRIHGIRNTKNSIILKT